jgi:DNA repair exonuclease SbcCD ATPase subunit
MLILESITIQNFLSIGAVAQTVSLADTGLTLVLGLNLDTGGEESRNGAGKTALMQAIAYALYGEPLSKIRVDNLINDINGKNMLVSLRFRRDGVPYRIERGRKPNVLRFFVGSDEVDMAQGENRHTQTEIERVVGMSRTMFHHIVALNTTTTPFLRMRPAEQREVIEELMGITQISTLADQLKLQIDTHKDTLRGEEATVKAISEANARIEAALEQARAEAAAWDRKQNVVLMELGERVERLTEVDITAELAIFDKIDAWEQAHRLLREQEQAIVTRIEATKPAVGRLQTDLTRYRREVETQSGVEVDRLKTQAARLRKEAWGSCADDIARLERAIERQQREAQTATQEIAVLQVQRDELAQHRAAPDQHRCHTCGQGLAGTDHLQQVIAALESQIVGLDSKIDAKNRAVQQLHDDVAALHVEIADTREQQRAKQADLHGQADAILDEVAQWQGQMDERRSALQTRIDETEAELAKHKQSLEEYYKELDQLDIERLNYGSSPVSNYGSRDAVWRVHQERERITAQLEAELQRVNPVASKIDGLLSTISPIDYTTLNVVTLELKHEQFLYKLLTSKDSFIRKRIIDQNLHYLNQHLNSYLEKLQLPHEVRFLPDLTVEIALFGREKDFESLSRGEMNRVILANSWAFRDLWENLNFNYNMLAVDELLDQGMDRAGVGAAASVLRQLADRRKNIFLISHREELCDQTDATLTITKQDGFSIVSVA